MKRKRGGEGAFYELTAFQPALAFWPACSKFSWCQFCSLAVFFLSFSHPFPNKIKNLWGKRKTTTELDWAVGYCIFHLSTSFAYSRCTLQSFPPLLKIQIAYKKGGEESADSMLHPTLAYDPAFSHIFVEPSWPKYLFHQASFPILRSPHLKYILVGGGKSFALLYYLIFHSFICLRATFLSQPVLSSPNTSKQLYLNLCGGGERKTIYLPLFR